MAEPYISENDVKKFIERYETTVRLGKKEGVAFPPIGNVYQKPIDVIMSVYAERLDKSSKRLNRLTSLLIALTMVLTIVGIFNIVVMLR